jgi:signal peptidase II
MKLARSIFVLLILLTTVGCDRITKRIAAERLADMQPGVYAGGFLRLEYAENQGAFLGLGGSLPASGRSVLLKAGVALTLAALVWIAFKHNWAGLALAGATLTFAGGLSNLFDRVFKGAVIDFMSVGIGPVRTGIFNVADVAIMMGGLLIAIGVGRAHPPSFGGAKNGSNR